MKEKLTDERRKKLRDAGMTIFKSFDWENSRMGYEFWDLVWLEIERMVDTGEP